MGSQRFCLRWNNHQSNLLSVFDQLLHDEAFVDVTLAVEGQFLRAHKMVLSACSPYFQALFVGHPDKHPIVILKDVPFADMRSLLDFMYRGEVSVDQDRLTAFLKVAESLRIKGLTEVNEERCDLPSIANSLLNQSLPPPPPPNLHRISQHHLHHQQQLQQHYQQQQVSQLTPPPQQQQQQLQQQQQQQQSSQNNKRLAPNPYQIQNAMLNSALTAPKRKRGRPRKLSGSNPGTPNPHASDDQDDVRVNNIDNHLEGSEAKNGPSVPESNHCSSPRENGGSGGEESSASVSIGGPPLSSSSPKTATTTTVVGGPEEDHGEEDLKTPPRSPASLAIDAMSLSVVVKSEVKQEMTVTNRGGGGGGVRDQEDEPMDASDIEHETDEYNNYVKTERDGSKPSTSGQDNVPAYHGPTTDGMERFAALDGILRGSHPESDTSPREDDSDSDSLIVDGYNESDRDVENNNDVGESDVPLDNSSAGAEVSGFGSMTVSICEDVSITPAAHIFSRPLLSPSSTIEDVVITPITSVGSVGDDSVDDVVTSAAALYASGVHFLSSRDGGGSTVVVDSEEADEFCLSESSIPGRKDLLEYLTNDDGSVVCKWCGELLPSRTHWYRHKYKLHIANPPGSTSLFKCYKCNLFFKSRKGYLGHVTTRHSSPSSSSSSTNTTTTATSNNRHDQKILLDTDLKPYRRHSGGGRRMSEDCQAAANPEEYEKQREKEEKLVAEIIDRVKRECEAQGSTVTRKGYSRRSTIMNT